MKQYKHKKTGLVREAKDIPGLYASIASYTTWNAKPFIEEDWELVSEPEIPPGIVEFMHREYGIVKEGYTGYWNFVESNLRAGSTIHTIEVNGVEWSVGDSVKSTYLNSELRTISKFSYNKYYRWYATYFEGGTDEVVKISKPVTRKPVVALQGKDMYEGDRYYQVLSEMHDWRIVEHTMKPVDNLTSWFQVGANIFSSRALAEQYIRDNKPVYPAGLVEELMDRAHKVCCQRGYETTGDTQIAISKLKTFKP